VVADRTGRERVAERCDDEFAAALTGVEAAHLAQVVGLGHYESQPASDMNHDGVHTGQSGPSASAHGTRRLCESSGLRLRASSTQSGSEQVNWRDEWTMAVPPHRPGDIATWQASATTHAKVFVMFACGTARPPSLRIVTPLFSVRGSRTFSAGAT